MKTQNILAFAAGAVAGYFIFGKQNEAAVGATIRSVKEAMEGNRYKLKNIAYKFDKKIRVDFERANAYSDDKAVISFWIDRDYFKRNWPNSYDRY